MATNTASGLRATAACMLAMACSTEPSVWVSSSWHFACTLVQPSSKPFLTACQKVFDGEEWLMNTRLSGSAARKAGVPRQSVRAVAASSLFMVSSDGANEPVGSGRVRDAC